MIKANFIHTPVDNEIIIRATKKMMQCMLKQSFQKWI